MKNRYLPILASTVLAVSFALAPAAAFAAAPGAGHNGNGFFAHFASWFDFGARVAHADTAPASKNLPPSISGISAPTQLSAGQEGTWSIRASDPENGALSYSVTWGDEGMLSAMLAPMSAFTQTSTFTHTYANSGTYTVKFTVKDDAGHTAASSATVRVVPGVAQNPVISNVTGTSATQTHATIKWTTDIRSDSTVYYSTTTPVATSSALSAHTASRVLNHDIVLDNLTGGTTYYFVVSSQTAQGGVATSAEGSFTTKSPSNAAGPRIASFSGPATLAADTEGTWTVNASDPKNGTISYAINWGDAAASPALAENAVMQTSTFSHTYSDAGTYTITVTATNAAGQSATATATVTVTAAVAGPTISGASALVKDDSINFAWTTDAAADSSVFYSASSPVTPGASGTMAVTDGTATTDHALSVTGLSAGTTYHFILESKDASGTTDSSEFALATMGM